jgi:hypothetical protein
LNTSGILTLVTSDCILHENPINFIDEIYCAQSIFPATQSSPPTDSDVYFSRIHSSTRSDLIDLFSWFHWIFIASLLIQLLRFAHFSRIHSSTRSECRIP